jgi:hypothetical protein
VLDRIAQVSIVAVAAHCRLGNVRRVKATRRQRGRVLRQSLRPGTRYRSDTKLDLRVGR